MPFTQKERLGIGLLAVYVPTVAYLITNAVRQDQLYDIQSQIATRGSALTMTGEGTFNMVVFSWIFVTYAVRAGLLVWLLAATRPERRPMVAKAVLLTCLIPEVFILTRLFPKYEGPSTGVFSSYGDLRTVVLVVVGLSCVMQVVAMIVSGLVARRKRPA